MVRVVKNPPANAGDARAVSSIPGLGRSPGGRRGNLLQYSCLGNPVDRGGWQMTVHSITKSWTQLKRLNTHAEHRETQKRGLTLSFQLRRGQDAFLSSGPRLLSCCHIANLLVITLTQADPGTKPLNVINTKSFPLAKKSYKVYALISPEIEGKREQAKACGWLVLFFWGGGGTPK